MEEVVAVVVEQADVVDLETWFDGVCSFDSPSKGESGDLVGVVAAGFEDIGMDHAGASDFEPATFAEATGVAVFELGGAFTESAGEVNFE